MTKSELELIEKILYNCENCRYPSYRDNSKVFCSCCWAKASDPDYREKVIKKYQKLFPEKERKERAKSSLTRNEKGFYVKAKKPVETEG